MKNVIDFESEVLRSTVPVLVDFYADWCGPCRMMSPLLEELETSLPNKLLFFKIDVDKNQEIATKYNIMSIPTLMLFKNGEQIAVLVGASSKSKLSEWLQTNGIE